MNHNFPKGRVTIVYGSRGRKSDVRYKMKLYDAEKIRVVPWLRPFSDIVVHPGTIESDRSFLFHKIVHDLHGSLKIHSINFIAEPQGWNEEKACNGIEFKS